jgi:hypothetical protein
MKGPLVAKLKFWFGQDYVDLFNEEEYEIETLDSFVYVYLRVKAVVEVKQ